MPQTAQAYLTDPAYLAWLQRYRLEAAGFLIFTALIYGLIYWLSQTSQTLQILLGGFYAPRHAQFTDWQQAIDIYANSVHRGLWNYLMMHLALIGSSLFYPQQPLAGEAAQFRNTQVNLALVGLLPWAYVYMKLYRAFGTPMWSLSFDSQCIFVLLAALAGLAWYLRLILRRQYTQDSHAGGAAA